MTRIKEVNKAKYIKINIKMNYILYASNKQTAIPFTTAPKRIFRNKHRRNARHVCGKIKLLRTIKDDLIKRKKSPHSWIRLDIDKFVY